ncbi:MAG: hypothetical protein WCT20_00490 [Candidatus Babeliales bacterium]
MDMRSLSVTMHTTVKKVLMSSALFPLYIFGLSNQEIVDLANEEFSSTMPGIEKLIATGPYNRGSSFELEAALVLSQNDEAVRGLDLEITFDKKTAHIAIDDHEALLNATEFDIITDNLAVECKSGTTIDGRCYAQLLKEQTMLAWMHALAEEINNGTLSLHVKRHTHALTFFELKGQATRNKPLCMAMSWIHGIDENECLAQLIDTIQLLATKKLIALFRATIPETFGLKLKDHGIDFVDDIKLEPKAHKFDQAMDIC